MRLTTRGILALVIALVASAAHGSDPVARLHAARSLHCTYTSTANTWVRNGHRTVEQIPEKGSATYDNIDLKKGTARIIADGPWGGAGDITVWMERAFGALWMLERAPTGNVIITTVFPMYAEGTDEFIVLESRQSITGAIILGQQTYGTCRVLWTG